MAKLVDENGVEHTPEELAHEALADVEFLCEFNQNLSEELDIVARYANKDALIAARNPEKLWEKMQEDWRIDAVKELIAAKAKIITDQREKKELDEKKTDQYVTYLMSTGMSYSEAKKEARAK